ncbi:MAG: hypothetical protein KF824_06955 [Fimbriimonadaceae bacterium]|nr:MAG: hypothetical protein KF824_06955 [Fimbriimonadaceae bacterium]
MSLVALFFHALVGDPYPAQNNVTVPSEIQGDYIVSQPAVVQNQTIYLRGTPNKPARLIFQGNGSQFKNNQVVGAGKVVFWNAKDVLAEGNTFSTEGKAQLHLIATPNAKVLDNTFNGKGNDDSLLLIEPGHQWQLPDAATYGHKLNLNARFEGGQNRLQQINPLKADRRGYYSGGDRLRLEYGNLTPVYEPSAAHHNKWYVWGKDNVVKEARLISADRQGVTLAVSDLKNGPVRYITYNPKALIPGVVVRGNKLYGPGKLSGFSGYGLKDALIEGNTAIGFKDYGLGLEISSGKFIRNVASGNQESNVPGTARFWNQMEVVAPIGKFILRENTGMIGEVTWYYPQGFIDSDKETRKPKVDWLSLSEMGN